MNAAGFHESVRHNRFDGFSFPAGFRLKEMSDRLFRISARMAELNPGEEVMLFSAPGRTELAGNHTDHNNGIVLAAAVDSDILALVTKTKDDAIVLESRGYPAAFTVRLDQLKPVAGETGTTSALIRGVAASFKKAGRAIGGFTAVAESSIPAGSGLSSSAATEVLLACILNHLYNGADIDPVSLAVYSQYAENHFYGKPCGLMDQIACGMGGVMAIDFANQNKPSVKKIAGIAGFPGHTLCVVLCGGDHADLTDLYASIPAEMREVASYFKKDSLREVGEHEFIDSVPLLRKKTGDRPIMRAFHFFAENKRVALATTALKEKKLQEYLQAIRESGSSSWRLLQNCLIPGSDSAQDLSLALAVTEAFLCDQGACRVHGGGFSGTIQAYVPEKRFQEYRRVMKGLFGEGCVIPLSIREAGAIRIL